MRLALLLCVFLFWAGTSLFAQEFVDAAPILDNPEGEGAVGTSAVGGAESFGGGHFSQFGSGMVNYGYSNHVLAQYTGDLDYTKGASPISLFGNISYLDVTELEFYDLVHGWAWGLEWLYFSATPSSVASSVGVIEAPPVTMGMNVISTNGRFYFQNLNTSAFQPYIGVGLGVINGEMDASLDNGDQTRSTYAGLVHYSTVGANVKLGLRSGVVVEMRRVTAPSIRFSNDPYDQSEGTLILDFGGSMINLTGFYRF